MKDEFGRMKDENRGLARLREALSLTRVMRGEVRVRVKEVEKT